MKRVDIVVAAFNEELVVDELCQALLCLFKQNSQIAFRLIVVNDGSKDGTLAKLVQWSTVDRRVVVVDLSRNFGHEGALSAGLKYADADAVIVMDADLQDPPELIPALIEEWNKGYDIVNAHRASRKEDGLFKRWSAWAFYLLINSLSGKVTIAQNVGNYRLISRRVLDLLNSLPEKNRVFRVLIPYLGFPTTFIDFARGKRISGNAHYSFASMTRLAVDGITSATIVPLRLAIRVGMLVSLLGFTYLAFVLIESLILRATIIGWASLMSIILFLGGIQLVFLGVIGEYIGRIFLEVKNRPEAIVKRVYE